MKNFSSTLIAAALTLSIVMPASSEDIEVYVGSQSYRQGSNAKVMIIFDNSGSMRNIEEVKVAYNPNITYETKGYEEFSDAAIYFNRGDNVDSGSGLVPTSHSDSRRFNKDILGCETAWEKLRTVGYYTGYLREYQVKGNTGSWEQLPAEMGLNTNNPVDCFDDIVNKKTGNGTYSSKYIQIPNDRYPINGTGNAKSDLENVAYTKDWELANSQSSALQGGQPITLYTANYINYYHATESDVGTESKTRLEVAKETIDELLTATPGVDFGMMLFNLNAFKEGDRDGGRIVSGIKKMTDDNRAKLLSTLQEIDAETNTPLCESLMETKRYYAGETVNYGKKDTDYRSNTFNYVANTPPRDSSVEDGSVYISPYDNCSDVIYTILITDGEPTLDNHADTAIAALNGDVKPFESSNGTLNYLPVLSHWMLNNDINPELPGKQIAKLYTIGFGETAVDNAGQLLNQAAENGGGKYFAARSASALAGALQASLLEILRVNSSFTSPSVASNNFDRTRSLDSVYYAMFLPESGTRWSGNLKKLKIKGEMIVDAKGDAALDDNGAISETITTFWNNSGIPDGNRVAEGGVLAQLKQQANRRFLVDIDSTLKELKSDNFANGVLADLLNIDSQALAENIAWARGVDVDDDNNNGSNTDMRIDLMGDPLHSKPLVLSYGTNDIRIMVGTNHGFLHMFKDSGDSVEENWAYMPQELMKNIPELRSNQNGNPKVYGVDGAPVAYFRDLDNDGIIASDDKVWLFFGLRRGGSSYYALDITNPDAPTFMWRIDSSTPGFAELGQSWSKPVITFLKVNGDKPVLAFGAGFSTNKDGIGAVTEDTEGRGVFMVDAATGKLIKSFGAESGVKHSVPGNVAFLDTDIDAFADRLYFSDTGGNVWRADLVGTDTSKWTMFKFAELAQDADRRFFYEPTVARMLMQEIRDVTTTTYDGQQTTLRTYTNIPFDAVVLGSGSRPHPLYGDSKDALFMLRDMNSVSQLFTVDSAPATITKADLVQITDPTMPSTIEEFEEIGKEMTGKKGWYYELEPAEKSLSAATIISGIAYFTSYVPNAEFDENSCSLSGGLSNLYTFDLNYGYLLRKDTIEGPPLDKPELVIPGCEGEDCQTEPPCEGDDCHTEPPCEGDNCGVPPPNDRYILTPKLVKTETGDRSTSREYLVIDENN